MQCDTRTQTLVLTGPADYRTPTLDWCAVRLHRSGFRALLHAEAAPFIFSLGRTLLECWTESLFSVRGGQPLSLLSDHTMQSPFALGAQQEALAMWQFPHSKCSETVMMMMVVVTIAMMTAMPLLMASTHRLSGLHCSATFIKSQWVRSIYDCE